MGPKALLVGDGRGVPDDVGHGLPGSVHGRPMGAGPSGPVGDLVDRDR